MKAQAEELAAHQTEIEFVCNICGVANRCAPGDLGRESGQCRNCGSYSRLRSIVHALIAHYFPECRALWNAPLTKRIKGVGCSDSPVYAKPLSQVFDYVNSHFDREPQLDLSDVDWTRWKPESLDFITASDVLEHVAPPVGRAFDGALKLLKPGGLFILTVPTTPWDETIEHFPDLADWELVRGPGSDAVLIDRKPDGAIVRHTDLTFHGGVGMTLEFRRFSRKSLLAELEAAGFERIELLDREIPEKGIVLAKHNMVVIAHKKTATRRPAVAGPRAMLGDDSPIKNAAPLFVLGAPRSGTTLCADLLNSHPEVLITNEVRAFSFFSHAITHIPDGDSGGIQYSRSHPGEFAYSLEDAIPSVVLQTFDKIARADHRGKLRFWGDKNPHHADCLELILGAFPGSRFIRMKRDPRDVACSIMEMNGWDLGQAARAVRANVQRSKKFLSTRPKSSWLDVSYEELVRHPEQQIPLMMGEFLGLEDCSASLAWMNENGAFDRHRRFSETTDFEKKSVARWQRELSSEQASNLNELLIDVIASEGY